MKASWYYSFLTGILLAGSFTTFAQTTKPAEPAKAVVSEQVYTFVEQMPTFQGGRNDSVMAYIRRSTRYPAEAIQAGVSGKVFVQFVINKQGQLEQAQVVKGVATALDQEALRVIQTMPPAWQPGRQQGQAVAVLLTVPFSFVMQTPAPAATNNAAAQYPGGPEALLTYLAAAPYPEEARATQADVRVFVKFKIDQTGKVIDAKPVGPLMRKPSATPPPRPATEAENLAIEQAAAEWVQAMPSWTPATLDGAPVESEQFILPLIFSPTPPSPTASAYPYADQAPVFGTATAKTDIHTSIQRAAKYPALALRNQMQGTVYLYCVVNETGALEKQQIVGSAGSYLDEAVLTASRNQPVALAPAFYKGKAVRVFYVIPFTFRIR